MHNVCLQVLSARDTMPVDFDPVFPPPASDPPRSLPAIITAGTSTPPPPPTSGLTQDRSAAVGGVGGNTDDAGGGGDDDTRRTIGIACGCVALVLLLCALGAVLWRQQRARWACAERQPLSHKGGMRGGCTVRHGGHDDAVRSSLLACIRPA